MPQYFGIDHFDNVTKDNLKLMNLIEGKHYAIIKSQPVSQFFTDLLAFYDPYHTKWVNDYTAWKSAASASMGATRAWEILLNEFTNVGMPKIEIDIFSVYPAKSPKGIALLPHKKTPYISGEEYSRITALTALIASIGADTDLADVKILVTLWRDNLLNSFNLNKNSKNTLDQLSKTVWATRPVVCKALNSNVGSLLTHFFETPEKIDGFFDIRLMRHAKSKISDDEGLFVTLEPMDIDLLKLKFKGTEIWKVTDNSDTDGILFFSDSANITTIPDEYKYILKPAVPQTIDLSLLPDTYRFAYLANQSNDNIIEINIKEVSA